MSPANGKTVFTGALLRTGCLLLASTAARGDAGAVIGPCMRPDGA